MLAWLLCDAKTSQGASVQIYFQTSYFHLVFNLKVATTTPGRTRNKMLNTNTVSVS